MIENSHNLVKRGQSPFDQIVRIFFSLLLNGILCYNILRK